MDHLKDELREAAWFKSPYSGSSGGNCVEIARLSGGRVGVRDSKHPAGPALVFAASEWTRFRHGVKEGLFGI
ncbi:DUF397 domain-containing protein [Sphaerisporangium perillae]|uniref:DUF397 domain-containing protein n=1 Tax=Sphaerisporangium perillae TaxID=2935860 RepID=UPI00200F45D6|nr:DUF397 domain-containing protein [Sphaerisporangium perillae]